MINLKRIRTERGMTQKELAELSDINIRKIQDYEQGHSQINKAAAITVYRLAEALNVGMEKLLEK